MNMVAAAKSYSYSQRERERKLVFWAKSTTRAYIRAEGDFRKETYSWNAEITLGD